MDVIVNAGADGVNIYLGRAGIPPNRAVLFDCSALMAAFPGGTAELSVRRPGAVERYTVLLPLSGDIARWTIGDSDISSSGIGELDFRWNVSGSVVKTTRFLTTVTKGDNSQSPTTPDWVEPVLKRTNEISNMGLFVVGGVLYHGLPDESGVN